MTRSTEFGVTVSQGVRAGQPDLVVHLWRSPDGTVDDGPRIGLVVSKAVGGSVQRHRVARRLRHAARNVITELDPADRVVIRALPSSGGTISARLEQELRTALRRTRPRGEASR
jgi:ribonuclease P protein component